MKTKTVHEQTGSSLAVVIITMALLIVVVGVATEYTATVGRHVRRANSYETALAMGDSCIDILFYNWRSTYQTMAASSPAPSPYPPSTSSFTAVPTPSPGQFPEITSFPSGTVTSPFVKRGATADPNVDDYDPAYTISNYKVVAVTPEFSALPNSTATPYPMLGRLAAAITSATILPATSAIYNYIASADITLPTVGNKKVVAKVRRVFQRVQMSPMDFGLFYVDPLEIHPGPLFTITGRVHTNSDLWTGHNTLTFGDNVTFGGNWTVGFMPGDTTHPESPTAPNYLAGLPSRINPYQMPTAGPTINANTTDGYREMIEQPVTGITDPYASQRYWDQASVVVQIDASNNVTIGRPNADGSITNYNVPPSDPNYAIYHPLYTMFNGAISTNQTIQDNREGATIRLASLDVSQILNTDTQGNLVKYKSPNFNGIVYIYDASATSSARRAIRIKNGSKIPFNPSSGVAGLTVISNNPVYLQGDFNTGGTGSTVPSNDPSNFNPNGTYINPSSPPDPQVSGYTRAPSSILADSVNILSNSWLDSNSTASLSSRPASATTINAAIVSGTVPTSPVGGDGDYSGGAENFPRFLEDWTNRSLTYYGSMVELWLSTTSNNSQGIGEWHYGGNIYDAPARNWFYDNNFMTKPPPGSAMAMEVSYTKGRWTVQ
jgi:hypothetical protein